MTNVYFTADHHFGHAGIVGLCKRPFRFALAMAPQSTGSPGAGSNAAKALRIFCRCCQLIEP